MNPSRSTVLITICETVFPIAAAIAAVSNFSSTKDAKEITMAEMAEMIANEKTRATEDLHTQSFAGASTALVNSTIGNSSCWKECGVDDADVVTASPPSDNALIIATVVTIVISAALVYFRRLLPSYGLTRTNALLEDKDVPQPRPTCGGCGHWNSHACPYCSQCMFVRVAGPRASNPGRKYVRCNRCNKDIAFVDKSCPP